MPYYRSIVIFSLVLIATSACVIHAAPTKSSETPAKRAETDSVKAASIPEALAMAKQENKTLFLMLGKDDCINCQVVRKAIRDGSFPLPKKQYLWVEFSPDNKAMWSDFIKRYNIEGVFPNIVIVTSDGSMLAKSTGPLNKQEFAKLIATAKSAQKKLK